MPTLKDVAKLAGVSVATASLALNRKPVSEQSRQLVLECARKLNYIPNKIGRTLSTGRSNTVQLLIINSKRTADLVKEISFFYYMIEGILDVMEQHDLSLHYDVKNWEDENLVRYFEQKVRDKTADGIIIIPQYIRNYDFLSILTEHSFPYIILNSCFRDSKINTVRIDNYNGGALVAELFLRNGFTRVAMINGPDDHFDAQEREKGFLDTLTGAGISVPGGLNTHGDFTIESGYTAAEVLLSREKPEAIFCANDHMAAGAMRKMYETGLSIPEDVSLVGYDNLDVARAVYPGLTTVDNRVYDVGKELMESLLSLIFRVKEEIHRELKPFLIIRESCAKDRTRTVETKTI